MTQSETNFCPQIGRVPLRGGISGKGEVSVSEKIEHALKNLRDVFQEEAHEHCVGVTVFINSEGYEIKYRMQTPGSLRRAGISMRNLRGEWVASVKEK